MKKLLAFSLVVCSFLGAQAQPPEGKATPGKVYGDKATTTQNAVDISTLPGLLKEVPKEESIKTKVTATVLDVCPKKGCWVKLKVDDGTEAFVKMKGYAFFVPLDMIGKTVVIDGEATVLETSVAELKHYAEDAKKSKEEIDAIKEPKKEIRLTATGIVVVK
jgi:hypothetical protein